jgi:hypothetical protein
MALAQPAAVGNSSIWFQNAALLLEAAAAPHQLLMNLLAYDNREVEVKGPNPFGKVPESFPLKIIILLLQV